MAITPHTHSEGSADASTKGIEMQRMSAQVTSAAAIPVGRIAQVARPALSTGKRGGESVPLHWASRYTTAPVRKATAPTRAPTPDSTAGPTTDMSTPASRPASNTHPQASTGPGWTNPVIMPAYPDADAMMSSGPSRRDRTPMTDPVTPTATSTGMPNSRVRNWANTAPQSPRVTSMTRGIRDGREVTRLSTNPSRPSTPISATKTTSTPCARIQKPSTYRYPSATSSRAPRMSVTSDGRYRR